MLILSDLDIAMQNSLEVTTPINALPIIQIPRERGPTPQPCNTFGTQTPMASLFRTTISS